MREMGPVSMQGGVLSQNHLLEGRRPLRKGRTDSEVLQTIKKCRVKVVLKESLGWTVGLIQCRGNT